MNLNQFNEKLERQFNEHPERVFLTKSLLLIICIIVANSCFENWFLPIISMYFLAYFAYQCLNSGKGFFGTIWDNFSVVGVPRTTTNDRMVGVAWVTWSIIILNVLIFFCFQTEENITFIDDNLVRPPYAPTLINYPLSFLTSMYLHGSIAHLFGNMTFLWAVGTLVEKRIGWKKFIATYHATGLLGGALSVIVYSGIMSEDLHSLGASGAISGIMGVYIVRCYFKKMTLPLPLFGFLPVCLNIQLNSFAVIGLFFAANVRGGIEQLNGNLSSTGYWAHLGGIAGGLWIAYRMKLSNEAIEERHRELGSSLFDGKDLKFKAFDEVGGFANAEKSLLIALDKSKENTDTLVTLARLHSYLKPTEVGCDYYIKTLMLLLNGNSPEITAVFREFFGKYHMTIEAESQYRIASLLYREGDYDLASRTLEIMVEHPDTPEPLREKSMLLVAKLLEKLTLHEAAQGYYRRYTECYPHSSESSYAFMRLEALSRC